MTEAIFHLIIGVLLMSGGMFSTKEVAGRERRATVVSVSGILIFLAGLACFVLGATQFTQFFTAKYA